MENKCPVCNYNGLIEPSYNLDGYASDEICPCCGFQFGYDDFPYKEVAFEKWRKKWIDEGLIWFSKGRLPPERWNAKKQLNEINRMR